MHQLFCSSGLKVKDQKKTFLLCRKIKWRKYLKDETLRLWDMPGRGRKIVPESSAMRHLCCGLGFLLPEILRSQFSLLSSSFVWRLIYLCCAACKFELLQNLVTRLQGTKGKESVGFYHLGARWLKIVKVWLKQEEDWVHGGNFLSEK